MKKFLTLAIVAIATTSTFAQASMPVQVKTDKQALLESVKEMTPTGKISADRKVLKTSRRAYADGVLMMRQEGSFYNRGSLSSGGDFTSVLVPPFTDFKFLNLCSEKEKAVWSVQGEALEADKDGNIDYTMSKGSSPYSLYSAPSISVDDATFSLVDFVQPVDSSVYSFNYLNLAKTGNYYSSNGSPFMTEDIEWDFDGDGTKELNKVGGIRQIISEKPLQPLVLQELFFMFYSTKTVPVPADKNLRALIRRVETDSEGYLVLTDTLALMDVAGSDIETYSPINTTFGRFGVTFASYEEDEFGTLTAKPIIIDDMFAVDIQGFDQKDVEIQAFWAMGQEDEAEFWSGALRPTLIVCNDLNGKESGTLRYYGKGEDPYCYNAVFYMYGEMDGITMEFNNQIAPVAGGESVSDGEGDDAGNPVYLFTNYPMFEEDGGEFVWTENYDFEGIPEWAEIKIDPTYYENENYTSVRGLHMVWFVCEPLPEGVASRSATIKITSARGAHSDVDITLVQGDSDPSGISTVKSNVKNENSAAFNMAGQRVNNDFKGLVIKNGRKFMNK